MCYFLIFDPVEFSEQLPEKIAVMFIVQTGKPRNGAMKPFHKVKEVVINGLTFR